MKVLAVDDNPTNLEVIIDILSSNQSVVRTTSG